MNYQQLEKLTGETYFEACLSASKKYGKDNYEVISTKQVKHSMYWGLGHKELVEIIVGIKSASASSAAAKVPARPLPSEEIRPEKQQQLSFQFDEQPVRTTRPESIVPPLPENEAPKRILASVPRQMGVQAYSNQHNMPHEAALRDVHGLRTIQEGNEEPHANHLPVTNDSECIDEILLRLNAVKDERKQRDKIVNIRPKVEPVSLHSLSSSIQESSESQSLKELAVLDEKLNKLIELFNQTQKAEEKVVGAPVPDLPRGLFRVKQALLHLETPQEIADRIVAALRDQMSKECLSDPAKAMNAAIDWFESKIRISRGLQLRNQNGPCVIVLVGPTGVGKTTTIAKLATTYGLSGRCSLALFTVDTYRIGATEQLNKYAEIIDSEVEVIYRPSDIEEALKKHKDKDLIIVDTAGRSQKAKQDIVELSEYLNRIPNAVKFLVMSSTSKYTDMLETIKSFSQVGFDHLIFTKTDETSTIGPLLAALYETEKSLAYITNGQNVPTDFREASFDFFREQLADTLYS